MFNSRTPIVFAFLCVTTSLFGCKTRNFNSQQGNIAGKATTGVVFTDNTVCTNDGPDLATFTSLGATEIRELISKLQGKETECTADHTNVQASFSEDGANEAPTTAQSAAQAKVRSLSVESTNWRAPYFVVARSDSKILRAPIDASDTSLAAAFARLKGLATWPVQLTPKGISVIGEKRTIDGKELFAESMSSEADLMVNDAGGATFVEVPLILLGFTIDGSDTRPEAAPTGDRSGAKLALAAREIFRGYIKGLPDGIVLRNKPVKSDGLGSERVKIYRKFGFGAIDAEGNMHAIVRGGKPVPLTLGELGIMAKRTLRAGK